MKMFVQPDMKEKIPGELPEEAVEPPEVPLLLVRLILVQPVSVSSKHAANANIGTDFSVGLLTRVHNNRIICAFETA